MGKSDFLREKLRVDNFTSWDREFRCLMYTKGVLNEEALQSNKEFLVREGKDGELRAQLMLNVERTFHTIVDGAATGVQAYAALKDLSAKKDKASKVILLREVTDLSMRNDEDVTTYAARASDLQDRLGKIGENISDDDLAIRFLNGLPPPYATFRQIHIVKNEALALAEVLPALLKLELEVDKSERDGRAEALAAHGRHNPSWKRKKGKDDMRVETRKCFYCGKPGHIAAKCRKKQSDEAAAGGRASAHNAAVGTQPSERVAWIVDSGASHHVVCDESSFVELRPLQPLYS